jgi:tetratricopeptide (TPR) repeat protein
MSTSDKTVWTVWDTTLEMIETRFAHLQPGLVLAFLARFRGVIVQDELLRLASLGMSRICEALYDGAVELPSWLNKALTVENGEWDDYFYRETRRVLVKYSLLQRVDGKWPGVSMHGLVQWRARKHEEQLPWDKWHLIAMVAGCAQLSEDLAKPQFRRELVAHVPAVEEAYLDELDVEEERKEAVWSTVGAVFYGEGRWVEAEELLVQALEKSITVLGAEHPDTLNSMGGLAVTYWNQGRWTEAEELQVQVMEKNTRALGPEHPDTLLSMANLALTYWSQGRWTEAEELHVQVMEKNTRALGPEHPDTLLSMANLALTYWSQGRWTEAEELEVQVMEKRTKVLGPEHPDTLTSMTNLALTYQNQGRRTEAEELQVQVVEKTTRVLGAEHPATLTSMANLVRILEIQGKDDAAIALKQQILELGREFFAKNPSFLSSFVASAKAELERSSKTD